MALSPKRNALLLNFRTIFNLIHYHCMSNQICYVFTFKSPCSLKQVLNGESLELWEAVTSVLGTEDPRSIMYHSARSRENGEENKLL